mmetsp:Transcript_27378/g.32101  ORF Transcript_27378/g.32101 Transcript_27378/m.32101 type:complete len:89 (+) Transcript_27378:1022-1288(+)
MIVDYKKKSNYSNLVSHLEGEGEAARELPSHAASSMEPIPAHHQKTEPVLVQTGTPGHQFDTQEIAVPQSRLTYRTGDSFDVSITSRS